MRSNTNSSLGEEMSRDIKTRSRLSASELVDKIKGGVKVENAVIYEEVIYPTSSKCEKTIKNDVQINDCIFEKRVCFESLVFKGIVDFSGSEFNQDVSFSGSHFHKKVLFSNNDNGHFRYAKFSDNFEMRNSQIDEIDLQHVEFNKDVDFQETIFSKKIDFSDAHCDKIVRFDTIKLGTSQFNNQCKILINRANFHKLMIHWNDLKGPLKDNNNHFTSDPSDLSALVENYTKLKWFKDADSCFLEYKKLQKYNEILELSIPANRNSDRKIWRNIKHYGRLFQIHFLDGISSLFYGHGVRLICPIFTGFALWIIFALIYSIGGQADPVYPRGLILSAKILTSSLPVFGELTGSCEIWSIIERILGAILIVTFTVVLARKTLR